MADRYLQINGVNVATPTEMKVTLNDIDAKSGRTASGKMKRDRITTKRKLEIKWGNLSESQMSAIMTASSGQYFNVTYLDPAIAGMATRSFYAGDMGGDIFSFVDKFNNVRWSGLSINYIEM
ncbi:hypothetical protein EQG49_02280 [Periweissella cryptocerci]|uniref:Phage tail protein n=1 Tax=Periweissella cryptocerci TaxID=2506420 RepID=A0A4P6YRT7_9LACO|nr:DUF6711 family protein [Periweissella cryptocerci]QBO35374.1 hypothetical protein EQG49_02280 [Periweissella cryptocerci]